MKFLFLKFCYAVEIGAYLAYVGHYRASKEPQVKSIMRDELRHMVLNRLVLTSYNKQPTYFFNVPFLIIGNIIRLTCRITPLILLDKVARIMEKFNIVSYIKLAEQFPEHSDMFYGMAENESAHEAYFEKKVS